MPQFDILTFFNQVFWLILIVFNFYLVVVRFILPSLAFSLKSRIKHLKVTVDSR
uniref:ATPase subunit 8 n=16 Tax=Saccharina TaxID=309357 RepID=F8UWN8_9PHAE|nr:ATPase subunit 8 [Saccharina japonica]YP_003288960.1 ATPase subunit 8 [Saccharina religiosa]YP_003288998.1 ATPase subunit 8 [Saccharina ochotensis]YP_003289075.1 ATPase subunit 8 [Saccharina diabolica]YP_003289126.1 ATPase subunit 8 [Saccharina longipedalis]YP_004599022.1 ATPase subunit 8 [Saccharina japonica x Saccharina latissima]YP_008145637.1 ATPase subunit 8 [Saccharina longissima]YP_009176277.1 ATPase subunit 8 [Saccharina sp. ye-B]YP_009176620.1 ATPase subunit 8 [Saccharina sp. ye